MENKKRVNGVYIHFHSGTFRLTFHNKLIRNLYANFFSYKTRSIEQKITFAQTTLKLSCFE